jgi:hypothetical protein
MSPQPLHQVREAPDAAYRLAAPACTSRYYPGVPGNRAGSIPRASFDSGRISSAASKREGRKGCARCERNATARQSDNVKSTRSQSIFIETVLTVFIKTTRRTTFFANPATNSVVKVSSYDADQEILSVAYTSAFSLRV